MPAPHIAIAREAEETENRVGSLSLLKDGRNELNSTICYVMIKALNPEPAIGHLQLLTMVLFYTRNLKTITCLFLIPQTTILWGLHDLPREKFLTPSFFL